jgi:hypothetical protein
MVESSMLAVGAIVAAGAALQASVGIGFAVLAAPLLVILAPERVPGPMLLLGFLVSRCFVRHVDKSRAALKRAVLGVSAVAALALLLKPLL